MKIHSAYAPEKCLNISGSDLWGSNANLYDCDEAEPVYFGDDDILHLVDDPDFCINVYQSGVPWNQNNFSMWGNAYVNVYHCDWVIDSWVPYEP